MLSQIFRHFDNTDEDTFALPLLTVLEISSVCCPFCGIFFPLFEPNAACLAGAAGPVPFIAVSRFVRFRLFFGN